MFDPIYYARRYPEIAPTDFGLLRHFVLFGQAEQRVALSPAARLNAPEISGEERPCIILVLHEASRTGAPIVGWNLTRDLAERYNVVVVLKSGGTLEQDLSDVATAVVHLPDFPHLPKEDFDAVISRLVERTQPIFAITNSAETRDVAASLSQHGVGVVCLVHEFSANVNPKASAYDMLVFAHHLVFPADIVAQSYADEHPFLNQRRITIAAQGEPLLPPARYAHDLAVPQNGNRRHCCDRKARKTPS